MSEVRRHAAAAAAEIHRGPAAAAAAAAAGDGSSGSTQRRRQVRRRVMRPEKCDVVLIEGSERVLTTANRLREHPRRMCNCLVVLN